MTGLIVGFVAAIVFMALVLFLLNRRLKNRHNDDVRRYDAAIVDLRQERAEDKETNRRLRHELVSQSPGRLVETANSAEIERDSAVSERDQALEQLHLTQQDLSMANGRLADREAKLRQYREALKEIRMSLEAQDRVRSVQAADHLIDADTGELPAGSIGGMGVDSGDLRAGDLKPSDLSGADLQPSDIESAGLQPSDLQPSDLSGPARDGADMQPSEIESADVSAVD
ncbi:MAG: hypothetical protein ACR2QK_06410 [Acidimicrobiales bacterium]